VLVEQFNGFGKASHGAGQEVHRVNHHAVEGRHGWRSRAASDQDVSCRHSSSTVVVAEGVQTQPSSGPLKPATPNAQAACVSGPTAR
jgi:hypothetical protein